MAKPDNLPIFIGWRQLAEEEEIGGDDVLVCIAKDNVWFRRRGDPSWNPPAREGNWVGATIGVVWARSLSPHFWVYRKIDLTGMPDGLRMTPGFYPIDRNEIIQADDPWHFVASPPVRINAYVGSTAANVEVKEGKLIAWPCRYCYTGSPSTPLSNGPRKRRFPPHPIFSKALPLP